MITQTLFCPLCFKIFYNSRWLCSNDLCKVCKQNEQVNHFIFFFDLYWYNYILDHETMIFYEYFTFPWINRCGEWGDHVTLQAAADMNLSLILMPVFFLWGMKYGVKICVITSFKDTLH
ncbi:hypothetical protein SAY87_019317 [Trapa incisa]|uniref:Uncharacterized protein n=1 Tax=Trapa incisa TaxID=236973 RepID=A0AAN7K445_9MYRT|nr:hypothetical protein SAY87_019317 [Trapa incisa]